jgi:hypothetical protein
MNRRAPSFCFLRTPRLVVAHRNGRLGKPLGGFLALEFALRGGHGELDRQGKRGGVGVRTGGLKQLLGRRRLALVAPVADEDRCALGQYAPQAPHEIADMCAVNVLTIIESVDEKQDLEGMLKGYHASLSELCHPNRGGLLGLFGTLDTTTGETTYSDKKLTNFRPVLGAVMFIALAENAFDRLDAAVLRLAELQHRVKPVGASEGKPR